jgi:hypothetical protein
MWQEIRLRRWVVSMVTVNVVCFKCKYEREKKKKREKHITRGSIVTTCHLLQLLLLPCFCNGVGGENGGGDGA